MFRGAAKASAKMAKVGFWGNTLVRSGAVGTAPVPVVRQSLRQGRGRAAASAETAAKLDGSGRLLVQSHWPLKGQLPLEQEDVSLGGRRVTRKSLQKVPAHYVVGASVNAIMDRKLDEIDGNPERLGKSTLSELVFKA